MYGKGRCTTYHVKKIQSLSVSKRVDTTLHKTLAVSTVGDTQLIFFDTPGIVDPFKKKHYADSLLRDPHSVLAKADVIIVVVDLGNHLAKKGLHPEIVKVGILTVFDQQQWIIWQISWRNALLNKSFPTTGATFATR